MSGTTGRPGWAMCCSAGSIDRERVRRAPRRPVASPPVIGSQGALLGAEALRRLAEQCRVEIDPGLTGVELDGVEQRLGLEFADDHRAFLAAGLPVGRGWPDWRDGEIEQLRERLEWPVDGVLFDVEHNVFWHPDWGTRPARMTDALAVAR